MSKKNQGSRKRRSRPASGPAFSRTLCLKCKVMTVKGKLYPMHVCKQEDDNG